MTTTRRVIVTGATGLIGKRLCARLQEQQYDVIIFSREPERARQAIPGAAGYHQWLPNDKAGAWTAALEGAYGVVHLAGAPVFGKRWSPAYKMIIRDSRVVGTRNLVTALGEVQNKPTVFVCGSAVGYYGFRDDTRLDESAPPGDDFLARVCAEWEQEGSKAEASGIRTILLRTGIVLDTREGALPKMLPPFRLFVGGPILPGTQWFSWVHVEDEVGIILLALENEGVSGPLNAVGPEPETNRDFSAALGKAIGRPSWMPVPGFALKLLLGEVGDMLTEGQRVIPQKALSMGYQFRYPTAEATLKDLLQR